MKSKKDKIKLNQNIHDGSHPPVTESQVNMAAVLAGSVVIRFATRARIGYV